MEEGPDQEPEDRAHPLVGGGASLVRLWGLAAHLLSEASRKVMVRTVARPRSGYRRSGAPCQSRRTQCLERTLAHALVTTSFEGNSAPSRSFNSPPSCRSKRSGMSAFRKREPQSLSFQPGSLVFCFQGLVVSSTGAAIRSRNQQGLCDFALLGTPRLWVAATDASLS